MTLIKDKIKYLKEVKLKEIEKRREELRLSGDLSDDEEYDMLINENNIQGEIFHLEELLQNGDEVYELTNEYILNKTLESNEIFGFFGNDDFVIANGNKVFTPEEEIAIIFHSDNTSMKKKLKALENRKDKVSPELKAEIEDFINYKNRTLEKIKAIKSDDIFFAVELENWNDKYFCEYYRTFDQLMKHGVYGNTEDIKIMRLNGADSEYGSEYLGSISFAKNGEHEISNVYLSEAFTHEEKKKVNYPLINKLVVELNCPYKAYDMIKTPFRFPMYVVVADVNNPVVKKFMQESLIEEDNRSRGWAKISMATWYLENTNYGNVKPGNINLYYGFEYFCSSLSRYKKLGDDITKGQMEYIAEIKRQVEETDNLNQIPIIE